jgi:hypothetical protein
MCWEPLAKSLCFARQDNRFDFHATLQVPLTYRQERMKLKPFMEKASG